MTAEELDTVRWFVMRAHRAEKKAAECLSQAEGMEFYIPMENVVRIYHGKKTRRQVPVIPGLVFVHASQREIVDFKNRNNFLQFVIWKKSTGPEYLTVPENQMRDFIRVTSDPNTEALYLRPDEVNIAKGTRVRIMGGQLDGVCGVFMKVLGKRNRRLVIMLDGVGGLAVEVSPDLIEVIE